MSKRSQKIFTWFANGEKWKHVVSFRDNVYLWDNIIPVTLKARGVQETQVWLWEERNEKSGWYSVQRASGNREYTRKVIQNIRDQFRHDAGISEISIYSEKMHISIWTRCMASSMQAALHMDPSYEHNLDFFKNSEIKKVFPANVASSLWEKPYIVLKNKQ